MRGRASVGLNRIVALMPSTCGEGRRQWRSAHPACSLRAAHTERLKERRYPVAASGFSAIARRCDSVRNPRSTYTGPAGSGSFLRPPCLRYPAYPGRIRPARAAYSSYPGLLPTLTWRLLAGPRRWRSRCPAACAELHPPGICGKGGRNGRPMLLVTGGAGFIGSNLVAGLNDAGRTDIVVNDVLGHDGKWRNLGKRQIADFVPPADLPRWLDGRKLEAVVHLGAISDTTAADGDAVIQNNFRLSLRLLDWCTESRTPFIYASSAATYGGGEAGFKDDWSLTALRRLRPLNLYS